VLERVTDEAPPRDATSGRDRRDDGSIDPRGLIRFDRVSRAFSPRPSFVVSFDGV